MSDLFFLPGMGKLATEYPTEYPGVAESLKHPF